MPRPCRPPPPNIDPLALAAALLRFGSASRCVLDVQSGEVHRLAFDCDPEEDDTRFDDMSRFLEVEPLSDAAVDRFWTEARVPRPRSGFALALAEMEPDARARLVAAARALAREWLARRGVAARLDDTQQ